MSNKKMTEVDQISVTALGVVQVRCKITEQVADGVKIFFHRHTIAPGVDYSAECDKVKAVCAEAHTADVIESFNAAVAAQGA
jgi:hypothetical protein